MELQTSPEHNLITFEQAKILRDEISWQKTEFIWLEDIIYEWLETLSERTRINYRSGLNKLCEFEIINPLISLQAFALVNHDANVDKIKQLPMTVSSKKKKNPGRKVSEKKPDRDVKETTRQARAALYISFIRYLSRRFKGIFTKVVPSREGNEKTFFRVHEKVTTEAMNQKQWMAFFVELEQINSRDALIGKVALQGGKRIREVLSLHTDQIDWGKREITFKQSKTRGVSKHTVITYSESIMKELLRIIGERKGYVFLSAKGNPVILNQVANTFARAGELACVPFKVTPHVLRASAVTYLKGQGFADSDIMKITGHASGEMIRAYDKSERADNPTKKVNLVG